MSDPNELDYLSYLKYLSSVLNNPIISADTVVDESIS